MIVTEQHGEVHIHYDAQSHPHLFVPRKHPQQPVRPSREVERWLFRNGNQFWMIQQFYHMRITFKDRSTAALFRLTFA